MLSEDSKTWVRSKAFDQSPVSISVIDRKFKIVDANQQFTDTYGAWIGRRCYSVYKCRETRCEECAAAETFDDGQTRVREEKGRVCNGRAIDYLVHMVPLIKADGEIPFVIEMSTDITEMKLLERDKLEAERLAVVGQTVAGLAHGIKNIIMGLEGGMYVIGTGIRKTDSERIGLGWEMLEENVARISAFAKEFLEFARGRKPQVALVDSNAISHKVVELYRDGAGLKGIELRENLAEGIAAIAVDGEAIHTCLANLVSNAIDACDMSDKPNCSVTLTTREENGAVIFEVADNGQGMDYDVKQKVFTNFFSTKGSDKGTGLGLLTTRKIIQEHGGTISFDSTEGAGSVFRITLPRNRLPKMASDSAEAEKRSAKGGE